MKINKKKFIIILLSVAVVFAVVAVIVHQTTKITNESYENCALGDVNGDGYINSADALLVIQGNADEDLLFDSQKKLADVNEDGDFNSMDALILLRYTVGEFDELPYDEDSQSQARIAYFDNGTTHTTAQIMNEWENEDGTHSYQLNVVVKNLSDNEIESWTADINLSSIVEIEKDWDCESKNTNDGLKITGESISTGSAATCGIIVTAPEGLTVKSIKTAE